MEDFEPPSFSLGLDFDIDSEPQSNVLPKPSVTLHTIKEVNDNNDDDDDDFVSPKTGTDTDPKVSDPPRSLKRLRRSSISKPEPVAQKLKLGKEAWSNVDDDIEEFSSQEDEPKDHPKCHSSVCGSSKIPLQGQRVLASQSVSRCTGRKNEVSNVSSISQSMGTSTSNLVFPELTISPLRRFQLIGSDSDEPSKSEVMEKESDHVDSPLSDQQNSGADFSFQRNSGPSAGTLKTKDLWEDFCSDKTFNIATPALDEVCEEYFKSVKDGKRTQTSNSGLTESNMRPQGPLLPAHCYFFHKDPRIQKLVRDRLPNFFPLGTENIPGQKQDDASVIDYMGQFCHEGGSKRTSQKSAAVTNSRKGRKNVKRTNSVEESQGSERWVNPKSSAGVPKDAGRRRVQAVDKSAGHWYTSGDGKKVYVAKNGQEFSGQSAYRCYRKESGAGFKKSTKKTTGKRKAVSKKK